MIQAKYEALLGALRDMGSVMVAFSGGVDSTFLMAAAKEALGDRAKALTVKSPYIPRWEIKEATELAERIGIQHEIYSAEVAEVIRFNPEDRCYLCKTAIFSTIKGMAEAQGFAFVVDGSNADDTKDYRPGLRALKEIGVRSPLMEVGLTKSEIRELSRLMDLPTWDKPPYACLLTRLPYGTELKEEDFRMIEAAELAMMSLGFRAVRVRKHGDLARIEVDAKDRRRLFDEALLDQIGATLKTIGFAYVTLDVSGYQMGSFNQNIQADK